ncbi:hypothetical protein [Flavobacterium sp.]|uniref:hypothetical protein n=1 Tax=Flavobacterium sp. TaxID=239 RepID=UPI00120A4CF8|nr:hypothetical protein [Flavobacterium sp.]RZJ71409.1 MAG: hypothetical protein EOO49_10130 [Flavobacterium sp.]
MKRFALFLSLIFCLTLQAQKRKPLPGKVTVNEAPAEDNEVKITNLSTGEKAATTPGGFYTLNVRKGDTLMYKGIEIVTRKMVITAFDLDEETLLVNVKRTGEALAEVKVDNSKITSEGLGIPTGKAYTPADRKLQSATTTKAQRPENQAYTAVGTDGALNAMSGRTAQLKKEAAVEKKISAKERLESRYDRAFYIDTLKIPASHVDGFLYYAVDDKKFVTALDTDNEEQIQLQLGVLATRYRKTLTSEKK